MTRLSTSVAVINARLGVDGVILHGKRFTNEELRQLQNFTPYDWILCNVGRTFKAPKGRVLYTIKDAAMDHWGAKAICDTPHGQRTVQYYRLKKMEVVIDA